MCAMFGSQKKCSNCNGKSFRRVKLNRTIQCEACLVIVEEKGICDLIENHAVTNAEEVHCAVTADLLHRDVVYDISTDPHCPPGFITSFRLLSPRYEPVYAASARNVSGSIAEMERVVGDALFSSNFGCNSHEPGSAAKKYYIANPADSNKRFSDAKKILVAFFEIMELANILDVEQGTAHLAVHIFRHTANNTSLYNLNLESLATAAFVSATERRWIQYQEWLKEKESSLAGNANVSKHLAPNVSSATQTWQTPPKEVPIEKVSVAVNLDVKEILQYLNIINIAQRKQRIEKTSCTTAYMSTLCSRLDLPDLTCKLAICIAENAFQNNICSRRKPVSIFSAATYLACKLQGIRKTQMEICRATKLTEVTLRKVYYELSREKYVLLPDWYGTTGGNSEVNCSTSQRDSTFGRHAKHPTSLQSSSMHVGVKNDQKDKHTEKENDEGYEEEVHNVREFMVEDMDNHNALKNRDTILLVPPPLPPGFRPNEANQGEESVKIISPPLEPFNSNPEGLLTFNSRSTAVPNLFIDPNIQALVNEISQMPGVTPPPPPPSLPSLKDSTGKGRSYQEG